jgi:glutaredoxin
LKVVTLYTKQGCHLCEEALAALRRLQREIPFELSERDIAAEENLHRSYFERIPVVAVDGEELFDYFLDEDLLRERLSAAS